MNRVGVMVDVSRVSDETIDDVLETRGRRLRLPLVLPSPLGLPRNLADDHKRIAAKGGVDDQRVVGLPGPGGGRVRAELDGLREKADALRKQYEGDPKRAETEIGKLTRRCRRKPAPFRARSTTSST